MADDADIANTYIINAIESALGQRQPKGEIKMAGKYCKECEEAIPLERRQLGFSLCVECAKENERIHSLFADH